MPQKIKEDIVRVLRVIEYIGTRSWVENTITTSINGTKRINRRCSINAATIGTYPEVLVRVNSKRKEPKFEPDPSKPEKEQGEKDAVRGSSVR